MSLSHRWVALVRPRARVVLTCILTGCFLIPANAADPVQPPIGTRKAPEIRVGSLVFRDVNRNGKLDRYEDWRLPVEARVADLISKMTLEEKAGLMIHSSLQGFTGPNGVVLDAPDRAGGGVLVPPGRADVTPMDRPSPSELVDKRNVRWILVRPNAGEPPEVTAQFSNAMQERAEGSRLGIPIAFSSDPRHSPRPVPGAASIEPQMPEISRWPEQIGFGALRDAAAVREFGRIAAQELRALGIVVTLSPMADSATEPRWNRIPGTFGEDANLNAELVTAYIEGFQGASLGRESVMCVTKHFPGDGPVKAGLDPHNDYGKWQVYPGNHFEYHLGPFRAAIAAHTGAMMPGYAIPVGMDTVGMGFSKMIVTDLLRGKFGFNGLVVTDWLRNMPWGVEQLSEKERQLRIVQAGVDQIGGDNDPKYILELVKAGAITESRIDESAARILKPMFELGLFENPYVDPARAKALVNSAGFRAAGERAQRASIVLLKNAGDLLPLAEGGRIFIQDLDAKVAAKYGSLTSDVKQAQVAIVKVNAPYALHKGGVSFARGTHEGTLAYEGAENADELQAIQRLTASGIPTVVCMYLDRPAVLTEFIDQAAAVMVHFSSSDDALLDVIFGRARPAGKLPFDLPRDMASVLAQKEDVPFDLGNPLFRAGFGLLYEGPAKQQRPR